MVAEVGTVTNFGDTSSTTATGTRTCGDGNFLVATVRSGGDLTQGDIAGWTYVGRQTCNDAPFYQTSMWFKPMCPGGDNSITVTRAAAGILQGTITEFSGMGAGTLFMTAGFGGYGIAAASAFPTTGTLPQAVCLIFCSFFAAAASGDTTVGPSGYTVLENPNSPLEYMTAYEVTSTTDAQTPYWSMNPGPGPNVENANIMAVFAPALPALKTITVTATAVTTAAVQKLASVSLSAQSTASAALSKSVSITLAALSTTSVTLGFARVLQLVVSASVTTSATVQKTVGITLRGVVTTSASVVGIIAQGLVATAGYVKKLKARFWSNR